MPPDLETVEELAPLDAAQGDEEASLSVAAGEAQADQGADGELSRAANDGASEGADTADDGELVITLEGEAPAEEQDAAAAPAWVKDLRKANREKDRRIRELESKLAASKPAEPEIVLGPEPDPDDFDVYTPEGKTKFRAAVADWHERRAKVAEQQRQREEQARKANEAWQSKLTGYAQAKASIRLPDFDEAEAAVLERLDATQQGIIVQASKTPAHIVYALGKSPKRLAELAAIKNPVEFAVALGRTEGAMQVTKRKPATAPERAIPRSSMSGVAAVDNELAKLQEQAARTGDRTQVVRYLQGRGKQAA